MLFNFFSFKWRFYYEINMRKQWNVFLAYVVFDDSEFVPECIYNE